MEVYAISSLRRNGCCAVCSQKGSCTIMNEQVMGPGLICVKRTEHYMCAI